MKASLAVIALGLLVSACASGTGAVPAAEIQSMSGDQISVIYHDGISGMGDASHIAGQYCDPTKASAAGKSSGGTAPDKTVVAFKCK